MSFPSKPSINKSSQLKRQASINSGGGHSHDNPSTSESFLQSLNPRSTLLFRAELPKPMSRLKRGWGETGDKTQVVQVKPQKSCESYDSTASGMSWSSSQSAATAGGGHCNSAVFFGNPSFFSFEEGEELEPQQIDRILSTTRHLPRGDNSQQVAPTFRTGHSFDEVDATCEGMLEQVGENQPYEEANEENENISKQPADFFESVFDEQEKELFEDRGSMIESLGGTKKKKSFKRFWKLAYNAIRSEAGKLNEEDSELGLSRKVNGNGTTEVEVDPVYQLLKSAANQGHLPAKPSTSFNQSETVKRTQSLSSRSRMHSASEMERSQPP